MRIAAALLLSVAACVSTSAPTWVPDVVEAIHDAAGTPAAVRLADHTPFDWDEVYAFAPYADATHIDAALGITWDGRDSMERDETHCLLVFIETGTVTEHVKIPRRDFGCLSFSANPFDNKPDALTPSTARFTVTTTPARGGGLLYTLHPAQT